MFISLLAAILNFKMAAIFNIFWPFFQLLSSSGAHNGGNTYAYDAKGCDKSTWKVTGCFFLGGHLKFLKWPQSRFQNGRHFKHIFDYISASELPRELKIVAIPMFVMLRMAINAPGKLLVVLSAAILNFKMAVIQISKWPPYSTYFGLYLYSELPKELKIYGGYIYVYNAKDCNKSIWKVTGPFPFGFQNGDIYYVYHVYDAKDCNKVTYLERYWSMFLWQPFWISKCCHFEHIVACISSVKGAWSFLFLFFFKVIAIFVP